MRMRSMGMSRMWRMRLECWRSGALDSRIVLAYRKLILDFHSNALRSGQGNSFAVLISGIIITVYYGSRYITTKCLHLAEKLQASLGLARFLHAVLLHLVSLVPTAGTTPALLVLSS